MTTNGVALPERIKELWAEADREQKPRPPQMELVEQLGVSRHHVRKALAELADKPPPDTTSAAPEPTNADLEVGDAPAQRAEEHAQQTTGEPLANQAAIQPPPTRQPAKLWPLILIGFAPAVAIWAGWVDLGRLTGFGPVHLFPGIWDEVVINTAVTLPISVEAYAAYAFRIWLAGTYSSRTTQFARRSALGSLAVGGLAQIAYHLLIATGFDHAPWWVTTLVACIPVGVFGLAAVLAHMARHDHQAGHQQ